MDITQLAMAVGAIAGVLLVALLAILPTLLELPINHRHGPTSP